MLDISTSVVGVMLEWLRVKRQLEFVHYIAFLLCSGVLSIFEHLICMLNL